MVKEDSSDYETKKLLVICVKSFSKKSRLGYEPTTIACANVTASIRLRS